MNYGHAQLWIGALRAGGTPQAKQSLGLIDGSRCCLGVQCDIAVLEKVIGAPVLGYEDGKLEWDGCRDFLPPNVLDWADFHALDPYFFIEYENPEKSGQMQRTSVRLSELNDQGYTFDQIADCIAYFWEEL